MDALSVGEGFIFSKSVHSPNVQSGWTYREQDVHSAAAHRSDHCSDTLTSTGSHDKRVAHRSQP